MTIRYRKLDADGDMVFGGGPSEFLVDSQEAIAQSILTRLKLSAGEWFLDLTEGTPYDTQILGFVPQNVRDFAIRSRILETVGVQEITSYSSSVDPNRAFSVDAVVQTIYGNVTISATF